MNFSQMLSICYFSERVIDKAAARQQSYFIKNITEQVDATHLVIVEDVEGKKFLKEELSDIKKIKVVSIYDEVDFSTPISKVQLDEMSERYDGYNFAVFNELINLNVKLLNLKKIYGFNVIMFCLVNYFEKLIKSYGINIVCFDILGGITSIYSFLFHFILKNSKIQVIVPSNYGLKGKMAILDNIHRTSSLCNTLYENKCIEGLSTEEIRQVKSFFNAYSQFKSTKKHLEYLFKENGGNKKKVENRKRTLFSIRTKSLNVYYNIMHNCENDIVIKRIMKIIVKLCERKLYFKCSKFNYSKNRYALLLLNKFPSGRHAGQLPYYYNIVEVVENISKSLPLTHSLVVKDHPHMLNRPNMDLLKAIEMLPNCFYVSPKENTTSLVQGSDIIFSVGSTSGLEALMQFKHVIVFGNKPPLFYSQNAPVKRITDFEKLPAVIRECVTEEPPKDKIYAYFYALLKTSVNRANFEGWNVFDPPGNKEELLLRVSKMVASRIKEVMKNNVEIPC